MLIEVESSKEPKDTEVEHVGEPKDQLEEEKETNQKIIYIPRPHSPFLKD